MIKVASSQSVFYRICIEGNIGCGKTAVLKHIASQHGYTGDYEQDIWKPKTPDQSSLNLVVSPEPITRWTSVGPAHVNLLSQMYTDPSRHGFVFEHYSQYTRYDQMRSIFDEHFVEDECGGRKTIHLLERSIFSNRFVFVENFFQSGKIHKAEYTILDEWFKHLMARPECQINKFIYLRTSPETVYERIQKRARSEDELIPMSYLKDVHNYHERLFDTIDINCWKYLKSPRAKVVVIDADQPLEDVCRQIDKHIGSTVI